MTPIDDRISAWLAELERELANDDPALRHDAVADAREHLLSAREELPTDASQEQVDELLADYGDPVEVAESYRAADRLLHQGHAPRRAVEPESEQSTPAHPAPGRNAEAAEPAPASPQWFGVVRDSDAWSALVYMLLALPLGIAWFTWTVVGGTVSGSLLVLIIGIPLLLAFLASIRGIALLDGRIVETLLGERMPRRGWVAREGEEDGLVARLKHWVSDRRTWTSIAYLLTMLPLGIAYFTLAVVLGSIALGCITAPIVLLFAAGANDVTPEAWTWPFALVLVPIGGVVLLALLHLARGIAGLHGAYAKAMLVGGEGASRRRRPVSTSGSIGRAVALAAVAGVALAVIAGIGTAASRASTEVVTRKAAAEDVTTLELDATGADVQFIEDETLDRGEVRIEARVRVQDDDEDDREVRIEQRGDTAKAVVRCDVSVWFLGGCESDVTVRVPGGGDIELVAETSSGDVEFAAAFDRIELRTGSGDLEGSLDAREVRLQTGSGNIDARLSDEVRRLELETGSGDVSVEAPGEWDIDVDTGSGDEEIDVPTDSGSNRSMRLRTGSGDIEVEPGAG